MTEPAPTSRVFSESEAYALVADNVKRETADLTQQVDKLTTDNAEISKRIDLADAAVQTEKARADTAEKALADYKAEVENERTIAARKDERVTKVRGVAAHLPTEFFTPERAQRWAQMDDDAFAEYVSELEEVSPGEPTTTPRGDPPRETAMHGKPAGEETKTGNLSRLFPGMTREA